MALYKSLLRFKGFCKGTESAKGGVKGKAKWLVYLNHFIIGWDDNIWWFALSLFLMEITPESLTFTATYGLAGGLSVLLFGAAVGDWVDKTSRLTVARVCVLVQNITLICCSLVVYVVIEYKARIVEASANEALLHFCYALIVAMAIISNLTNMGRKTAIERDWIVEICNKDKDMLANLSAVMRRISLLTMVVAPIVTGQVLSLTSHSTGALVVAAWNFLTIFLEYFLLRQIYIQVPQLHRQKVRESTALGPTIELMAGVDMAVEFTDLDPTVIDDKEIEAGIALKPDEPAVNIRDGETSRTKKLIRVLFSSFIALYKGWNVYWRYDVALAGMGLAALYLTVLGFHGITVGYAYSQGLSEGLIGGLLAAAAGTGIISTFLYPRVRRKIGLQRTGLYALGYQISWLSLCVISLWCPGSSFDPLYYTRSKSESSLVSDTENIYDVNYDVSSVATMTSNVTTTGVSGEVTVSTMSAIPETTSMVSISLLMTGIIGSRVGLWMADLTITQLFLETVDVTERGIVGGVQNSMNQLLELMSYVIVILLPVPEVFGYLVIISFCFICIGWTLFAAYVKKVRGYVFKLC